MQHQLYSMRHIAEIVGGQLVGADSERQISDLLIDSRHLVIAERALFFALVSARNDGHKYILDLYEKGVRAFMVRRLPETPCPDATLMG